MGYLGNPLDPWGADQPAVAYRACFEAMAASEAYDVLVLVHDFPYRSLPAEVQTANVVARQLLAATRDRPSILPVYVSLTSGEPPPETKAVLDDEGGGVPLLRGALEAFRAIGEIARWGRRHEARLVDGPWRPTWPALAADRTSFGMDIGRCLRDATRERPAVRAREPGPRGARGDRCDAGFAGWRRGWSGRRSPDTRSARRAEGRRRRVDSQE